MREDELPLLLRHVLPNVLSGWVENSAEARAHADSAGNDRISKASRYICRTGATSRSRRHGSAGRVRVTWRANTLLLPGLIS